jgi:hypothetical protein
MTRYARNTRTSTCPGIGGARSARRTISWLVCSALLAACARPPPAQPGPARAAADERGVVDFSAAGLKAAEVGSFLSELQRTVRATDAAAVASLASYPLRVTAGGERREIPDARAFELAYSEIVTPHVKAAIEAATVENLFANSQGVRIGRGEVWFGGVYPEGSSDYVVQILTINSD